MTFKTRSEPRAMNLYMLLSAGNDAAIDLIDHSWHLLIADKEMHR